MTDKPTSARPHVIDGVYFRCYRVGIMLYHWRSDDRRMVAGSNYGSSTYWAAVDGRSLDKRFRSLKNAMRAAVKAGGSTP